MASGPSDAHLEGRKTQPEHWDTAWSGTIRRSLPSSYLASMRNVMRLLRAEVRPGDRLLKLGCAPGKYLLWSAAVLKAQTAGVDYTPRGIASSRYLFDGFGLAADLRCEDVFETSFEPGSFDVVCSFGLIEHFDDPREIVRRHVLLTRPGGVSLIAVPNYGGWYARVQHRLNPENLAIHNLEIMSPEALAQLAPPDLSETVSARRAGVFAASLLSLDRVLPRPVLVPTMLALNALGMCQPFEIAALCPLIVLRIRRKP